MKSYTYRSLTSYVYRSSDIIIKKRWSSDVACRWQLCCAYKYLDRKVE